MVHDAAITTGETWHGLEVQRFHQDMHAKAAEALEKIPRAERDFSTMTMCYSPDGYKKVREVIMHAREELARIEECDKAANRVYQINLQLFPQASGRSICIDPSKASMRFFIIMRTEGILKSLPGIIVLS